MDELVCEVIPEHVYQKNMKHDLLFKVILIGDSATGKSCLLKRLIDRDFSANHEVTIGVACGSFSLKIDDCIVKL